jgi:hypothetical protein
MPAAYEGRLLDDRFALFAPLDFAFAPLRSALRAAGYGFACLATSLSDWGNAVQRLPCPRRPMRPVAKRWAKARRRRHGR